MWPSGKGKDPWSKALVGTEEAKEAYTLGARGDTWMPKAARHHASTSTFSTFYTLAGQSSLRCADATSTLGIRTCTLPGRGATCICSVIGREELGFALQVADEEVQAVFVQEATRRNSEGTSYSRGVLLAARAISETADTTGTNTSVSHPTPISNHHCVSFSAQSDTGNAPRNGRDGLLPNADETDGMHSDETIHHGGTWPTATLPETEQTCSQIPLVLMFHQAAIAQLAVRQAK
jgi:hypothetical protein